jgi:chromosome segregation ATPase
MSDHVKEWLHEVNERKERIAELEAQIAAKDAALRDARDSLTAWAAYASDYFKDKHDYEGDLARIDAALAAPAREQSK